MRAWLFEYLYSNYPPVYIAAWSIVGLIISIAIICLIILISRLRKTRRARLLKKYTERYEDIVTAYVFDEEAHAIGTDTYNNLVRQLKKELKRSLKRSAFIKLILSLERDLKGDPAKRIIQLYSDIGLEKYALKSVKFGSWYQKAFEFTELGQMKVEKSLPVILKYLDHYNVILREEAQFAAVRMGGVENLVYLKTIKQPVSVWQQTRLMHELDQFPLNTIPSFYYLLEAKNETVVIFGLKLIANYRQTENPDAILALLVSESTKLRIAALEALVGIDHYPAIDLIISSFKQQEEENWPVFVNAIGHLGDKDNIPFLLELLDHNNYEVVMEATKALIRLGYQIAADTTLPNFNKEIYKHARYELIP